MYVTKLIAVSYPLSHGYGDPDPMMVHGGKKNIIVLVQRIDR